LISFYKYHGAGNDFILTEDPLAAFHIPLLCHRSLGIGADGVLLLESSRIADKKMRIFNSDGTEAHCCGNGLRCTIKHLGRSATIETLAGISEGIFTSSSISISFPKALLLQTYETGFLVDTGVPHFVIFSDTLEISEFTTTAKQFRHKLNANVTFACKIGKTLAIRTYERGVERETLSCGTGGAAAVLAYREIDKSCNQITITFPSHETSLFFFDTENRLWMEGHAEIIFEGNYLLKNQAIDTVTSLNLEVNHEDRRSQRN
jgi:diaminopimelate epimerase